MKGYWSLFRIIDALRHTYLCVCDGFITVQEKNGSGV